MRKSEDKDQQTCLGEVMNELALFAGAGGGILGGKLLGWKTICAVELNPYCRRVLMQRQNDGVLEPFPIWDDVCTFDGKPWKGIVDVVSGGFPCQDISIAGRGGGIDGVKSGLWKEMHRVVCEVRPQYVFVENSPMLALRGIDRVLSDLAVSGYNARWGVLGAADLGAPHRRDRIWIVANSNSLRELPEQRRNDWAGNGSHEMADTKCEGLHERHVNKERSIARRSWQQRKDWPIEPDVGRVAHGVANRVDRIRALGNGQVPRVAATAWRILSEVL